MSLLNATENRFVKGDVFSGEFGWAGLPGARKGCNLSLQQCICLSDAMARLASELNYEPVHTVPTAVKTAAGTGIAPQLARYINQSFAEEQSTETKIAELRKEVSEG